MSTDISVIIPCFNEKSTIASTISSATHAIKKAGFDFEIIVVDNGSTDGSDSIAKKYKAKVVYSDACTISGVRNEGVGWAKGKMLVFLDSDVVILQGWAKAFREVCAKMMAKDDFIAGSRPLPSINIKPILFAWYHAISDDLRDNYLGSGHMIMSMNVFKKIGGFDESMITGEDFDFCCRARKEGVFIVNWPELKVLHLGYPKTLIGFAKREIWHGMGDCRNWKVFFRSRIALAGIFFIALTLLMFVFLVLDIKFFVFLAVAFMLMPVSFNLIKFGFGNLRSFVCRSIISFVYLFCRGLSLPFCIIRNTLVQKRNFAD